VTVAPEAGSAVVVPAAPSGVIEIEFPAGARVRIAGHADPATVSATISALARAERRR
jgi:hypothetical protein